MKHCKRVDDVEDTPYEVKKKSVKANQEMAQVKELVDEDIKIT